MSVAKNIVEKIRKIAGIMDIDYDPKTNEFTQYSNDRFLLQELLMLYDEQNKEIQTTKTEIERLKRALDFCKEQRNKLLAGYDPGEANLKRLIECEDEKIEKILKGYFKLI